MNTHLDELITLWHEGALTKEKLHRLNEILATAEGRAAMRDDCFLEAALPEALRTTRLLKAVEPPQTKKWAGRFSWRPLTAAAAGLVFGMFCTSIVFAYVSLSLDKVTTLLQDSFESCLAPEVIGVPTKPGIWSGDFTEIVGEEQGVNPEAGKKMLRFLSADYDGKPNQGGYSADLFRLIDVRPFRREFSDGGSIVQLSAAFDAITSPADKKYECDVCIFALDADMATAGAMRLQNRLFTGSLAMARSSRNVQDRDPATWQRMACELRLPPNTDFLMIRIGVVHASHMPGAFAGHYADDVRVTMARREPLP